MPQEKKVVVDEVSGWLRLFDDGSVDRTWTGPPEVKFMTEPVPPNVEFIDGVATKDTLINETSGLRVRVYLPERKAIDETTSLLPIILHFHGGGFCISQADWYMYYQMYTKLVREANVICVSVYLSLAPEHRLPDPINDGFSALLWLRSLARGDSYEPWLNNHADFSYVYLLGDSTGGNIVHEVAARAGNVDLGPANLSGGILIHPGFVRSTRSRSELEQPQSPMLTLDMVDKLLSLALPVGANKDHPFTCPMGSGAQPLEGLQLPRFLVCVAERDIMLDTEMEYYEAMRKANKDVELLVSTGVGHSFYLNKIAVDMDHQTRAQTDILISRIKEFINK